MPHNNPPFKLALPNLLLNDAAVQAAYRAAERDALAHSTPATPTFHPTTTATDTPASPRKATDLTPHQIATKCAQTAKTRLATAHEGWTLAVQALSKQGIVPSDDALTQEMREFGDAICGRYTAASFLWRVLQDMPPEDWFGKGERFEATLRRLRTLKGLEGSLRCWEGVVLRLVEVVDKEAEGGSRGGDGDGMGDVKERVKKVLGKWRRGLPSKP